MATPIVAGVLAITLLVGACTPTNAPTLSIRPALPPVPSKLAACFARTFPDIPDVAFGRAAAVQIIANAKLLDRAKSACGGRAPAWIVDVHAQFGRH